MTLECETENNKYSGFVEGSLKYINENPSQGLLVYSGNRVIVFVSPVVTDIFLDRQDNPTEIQEIYLVRQDGGTFNITFHWENPNYVNGIYGPNSMPITSGSSIHLIRRKFHEYIILT